jgi:hypothetical protein
MVNDVVTTWNRTRQSHAHCYCCRAPRGSSCPRATRLTRFRQRRFTPRDFCSGRAAELRFPMLTQGFKAIPAQFRLPDTYPGSTAVKWEKTEGKSSLAGGTPSGVRKPDGRLLWRNMGGSEQEEGGVSEDATLEEVFTSRTFGHPLPEVPLVAAMAAAPKPYFARNRFIASGAVAAAALSIVAGLSIGSGRLTPPVISARSAGPGFPDFGTTTTTAGPAVAAPGGPASTGNSGAGNQAQGITRPSGGGTPVPPVHTVATGSSSPQTGGPTLTATVTVVGTGSTAPTTAGTGTPTPTPTPTPTSTPTGTTATPTTTTTTPPTTTTTIPVTSASGGPPPGSGSGSGSGNGFGSGSGNGFGSGSGNGFGSGSGNGFGSGSGNGFSSGSGNGFSSDNDNASNGNGNGNGSATVSFPTPVPVPTPPPVPVPVPLPPVAVPFPVPGQDGGNGSGQGSGGSPVGSSTCTGQP